MNQAPDTRLSLLARLDGSRDDAAWREFVTIYDPLIYRLARQRGLQDADAREVTQEILVAISQNIGRWRPDPAKGTFRSWIFRIARNMTINFMKSRNRRPLVGGSELQELFDDRLAESCPESQRFDWEFRRELFRWAVEQVRGEFRDSTWEAFWYTSVEGRPIANIAAQLGISVGAAYVARSRVMARIKQVVQACDSESRTW